MARSTIIALATFGSIAAAAVISFVWFSVSSGESRFEPAVGILGLLGGLAGILAERRAASQERRRVALTTVADELGRVAAVLADGRFNPSGAGACQPRVFPRLPTSAVDAALVSGALNEPSDTDLLGRLHQWRDEANGFNRRLELTEMRIFGVGATHELADFDRALHDYLEQIRRELHDLQNHLATTAPIAYAKTQNRRRAWWLGRQGKPSVRPHESSQPRNTRPPARSRPDAHTRRRRPTLSRVISLPRQRRAYATQNNKGKKKA